MNHEEAMADIRSFMKSRAILTAVELDIFTHLHMQPSSARDLCESLSLDLRAATRLLDSLITFGLLEKEGGTYRTTDKGAFLSSNHPETVLPMALHMSDLWRTWSGLTDVVRSGPDSKRESGIKSDKMDLKVFIGAMHSVAKELSIEIADDYDASAFHRLMDIGGASGTYTIAFLRKNPNLRAVLFDLEEVIPIAEERLREEGLHERVVLAAGNFYKDALPKGCDLALLSAIIHQNSIEENLDLYRKIFKALDPGGKILIRDHIMDESRTKPPGGAIFALNMLVNTHGGDTYTFSEVKEGLEKAGFTEVKLLRAGERMDCLVEARKPA